MSLSSSPTSNYTLIPGSTDAGVEREINFQSDTGALKVAGLSADTITLEVEFENEGFGEHRDASGISSDGVIGLSPLPKGTYRVNRSGNNDNLTVIIQQ